MLHLSHLAKETPFEQHFPGAEQWPHLIDGANQWPMVEQGKKNSCLSQVCVMQLAPVPFTMLLPSVESEHRKASFPLSLFIAFQILSSLCHCGVRCGMQIRMVQMVRKFQNSS